MEDSRIIDLYWARSERAITESEGKYGSYCYQIAYHILYSREDAEESVSDTWLGAWNSMPPHRPNLLAAFLGKITRRCSIDRWRRYSAEKRGGGEMPLALSELQNCVVGTEDVEQEIDRKELVNAVDRFLDTLQEQERRVFLHRYWYLDSVSEICSRFGYSKSKVTTMLHRTRLKLRSRLEQEGLL